MFGRLFLLFITVPFLEMILLMLVSKWIGIAGTLILILATGALGASLARSQGLGVLHKLQESIQNGIPPTHTLIEAVLVLIGGIVLLTPGLITDAIGFSLMVPAVRQFVARHMMQAISRHIASSTVKTHPHQNPSATRPSPSQNDDVIDI